MRIFSGLLMLAVCAGGAAADPVAHGKALAEKNCATCHAVGVDGPSPLREAPAFRDIAANYDAGELEDAFNDGVATEHPAMPDWQMTPEQAAELSAYVMSLSRHGMTKSQLVP